MADLSPLPAALNPIVLPDLTSASLDGNGVFDVLMRANKAHLQKEFDEGRIRGPEFSTVYLGSLQTVLATALQFVVQRSAANQEALIKAKTLQLMDVQLATAQQQLLIAQAQKLQIEAETLLTDAKTANAAIEAEVLTATKCKLQAEYDVLLLTKDKTTSETQLLAQKIATEKAQVTALGVDDDSVVGRQKALFQAQASGFQRDSEQKAAKLLIDSWNVRRTTDEGTSANTTNQLDDAAVGRAVNKLLSGIGA